MPFRIRPIFQGWTIHPATEGKPEVSGSRTGQEAA